MIISMYYVLCYYSRVETIYSVANFADNFADGKRQANLLLVRRTVKKVF